MCRGAKPRTVQQIARGSSLCGKDGSREYLPPQHPKRTAGRLAVTYVTGVFGPAKRGAPVAGGGAHALGALTVHTGDEGGGSAHRHRICRDRVTFFVMA